MDTIKSCGAEAENLLALDTTLVRAGRLRAQARLPCSAPKELFFANRFIFGARATQFCTFCGTLVEQSMEPSPRKIELVFFRNDAGVEPVREWLKELHASASRDWNGPAAGTVAMAGWHAVMPSHGTRVVGSTHQPGNRIARVLICFSHGRLVALHGFIKKTRATTKDDLALVRERQKELDR